MRTLAAVALTLFILGSAQAHDRKGPNGGRILDAGSFHVELVGKGSNVEVYITDQVGKPVATLDMRGVAMLSVLGKSQRVELEQAGDNKLSGAAGTTIPTAPKGVIQIKLPSGKTAQAKFN